MPRHPGPTGESCSKSSKNGSGGAPPLPMVPLGEIVSTHGLDGWLKLNPFNPETTMLSHGVEVFLERRGARTRFEIEHSKPHKRQLLVKLQNIDGIDAAEKLVGATLCVNENALDALEPGQYYHYQVVGFDVMHINGASIGKITSIMSTPGGELYRVKGAAKEHLIPAVKEFIEEVDFSAGKIIINPPDGLLDL